MLAGTYTWSERAGVACTWGKQSFGWGNMKYRNRFGWGNMKYRNRLDDTHLYRIIWKQVRARGLD
jgi:hypothetical protein